MQAHAQLSLSYASQSDTSGSAFALILGKAGTVCRSDRASRRKSPAKQSEPVISSTKLLTHLVEPTEAQSVKSATANPSQDDLRVQVGYRTISKQEQNIKVSEVMTRDVHVASPRQTLQDVAMAMAKLDTGAMPVGENDRLVGIVKDAILWFGISPMVCRRIPKFAKP